MINPFPSSFLSSLGKGAAVLLVVLLIGAASYFGYTYYISKQKLETVVASNTGKVIVTYKPGKAISTIDENKLKVKNEKLDGIIQHNCDILNTYYCK